MSDNNLGIMLADSYLDKLADDYINKKQEKLNKPLQLEESLGKNSLQSEKNKLTCSLLFGYDNHHKESWWVLGVAVFLAYCLAFYWCNNVVGSFLLMYPALIPIMILDEMLSHFLFSSNRKKRDEINKRIAEIDAEIKKILEPLDNAIKDVEQKIIDCSDRLLSYGKQLIFGKRSQSRDFLYNLNKFKKIIDEVYEAEHKTGIHILCYSYRQKTGSRYKEYIDYYNSRAYKLYNPPVYKNYNTVKPSTTPTAKPLIDNEAKEDLSSSKTSIPPEKKSNRGYVRVKDGSITISAIDWKAIGLKRHEVGLMGQDLVVKFEKEYLESANCSDLAQKVKDVNIDDGNNKGYDILSFFPDGREKYIEVKATTVLQYSPFNMSANELDFMRKKPQNAFVYRVEFADDYSSAKITPLTSQQIEQFTKKCVSYAVSAKDNILQTV